MRNRFAAILMSGALVLTLSPCAFAKNKPAGPMANVGTIACSSAPQVTQQEISYFKVGADETTSVAETGGAGGVTTSIAQVFEIHAPLGSASAWGQALNSGTQFSSCTISVPGKNGPESLTFSNLMVTSVLAVGKRSDDSPLPEYYTDVVFSPGTASSSQPPSFNLMPGKLQ